MAFRVAVVAFILTTYFLRTHSKVYHRCELAYELRDIHEIPEHQLATWICIANYESHFNTSAHNPGSGDHGLFQISELYWCSPPGVGFACGLPCAAFKDDDIEDDVICARRIYREHKRLSGDGFTAWVVYNLYCRNQAHVNSFIEGCFDQENLVKYPYNKYEYQYQAMNLPTVMVPMTTVPELPQSQPTSFAINFTTELSTPKGTTPTKQEQKIVSTESPILTTVTSAKPTKPKQSPRPSTLKPTTAKLLPSSVSPTPKPAVSTPFSKSKYKQPPSSSTSTIKPTTVKSSPTPKPVISTPLSKSTHKPLPPPISPTIKPPIVVSSPPPKPAASTPKPPPSARPTKLRHLSSLLTLKPLQKKPVSTTTVSIPAKLRSSSFKTSTVKPIFTTRYRSSSPITSITRKPRIRLTTPRRINAYDATKLFFTHTTSKPTLFTLSSSKIQVNSAVSSSSVSVVTPTSTYRNNDNIKPVLLKPRETKIAKYKPFEFNKNEVIYAVINKPNYSFAISSNGFKFVRTVR